jgi:hypothetical protein
MKIEVVVCALIIASSVYSSLNTVQGQQLLNEPFAQNTATIIVKNVSPKDITVTANAEEWISQQEDSSVNNFLNGTSGTILIRSNVEDITSMTCRITNSITGAEVVNKQCQVSLTIGRLDVPTLSVNTQYLFSLGLVSQSQGPQTLTYLFTARGGSAFLNEGAPAATTPNSQITGKLPPWTSCPTKDNAVLEPIPAYLHEIRYETTGDVRLSDVINPDSGELDLEAGVNFINGFTTGHLSDARFTIHDTHTECDYVAPVSAFSPQTTTFPQVPLSTDQSKASNPPFRKCEPLDVFGKYEINTQIDSDQKGKIKEILTGVHGDSTVKLVISQFFKKKTGEPTTPWYAGELVIIRDGDAKGEKIDLSLDGSDLKTTCARVLPTAT